MPEQDNTASKAEEREDSTLLGHQEEGRRNDDIIPVDTSPSEDEIQEELSALKAALITEEEVDDEDASKIHQLHEEQGMAGSRNAFPIDKNKEVKGQRPGMRIGLPNRHYHRPVTSAPKPLGKGAQVIDPSRPVNN